MRHVRIAFLLGILSAALLVPGLSRAEDAGAGADHDGPPAAAGHGEEANAPGGHAAPADGHGEATGGEGAGGADEGHGEGAGHTMSLPLWSVFPFVLMLLCIAVLPLTFEHWWEHNRNKFIVACVLGIPVGAYFLAFEGLVGQHQVAHVMLEYLAFMFLLGSLYIISGGIVLRGDLKATPAVNTTFLAIGTVLASIMGTTGAAMLLIRPVISTNQERKHKVHTIIFFTFLVANIGGSLTPLGDPPLFMGYLRGVPFTWTLGLAPVWAFTSVLLLVIYYFLDRWRYKQETPAALKDDETRQEKLSVKGLVNVPLLAGVVLSVAFGQQLNELGPSIWNMVGLREVVMGALAVASMVLTSKALRKSNEFTFAPIIEVAALFFGIFLTMIPAIVLLNARGGELPVNEPWHYFWATGSLSSFLDNTPTYIVFFELAAAKAHFDPAVAPLGLQMIQSREEILMAISLGAVFMGAMTYIGNGPNFMVKAIAEERGVKMPSFFGYMLWSCAILLPTFVIITLVFFL
jgi:Na+/H+ antiporter NhaD/arsenite permease-like protein